MGLLDLLLGTPQPTVAQAAPAVAAVPAPQPAVVRPVVKPVPQLAYSPLPISQFPLPAPRKPLTIDEIKKAATELGLDPAGGAAPVMPTFNIDDLVAKKDDINNILKSLPFDIRPLAALQDTVYGTKSYGMTPDLQADALGKLKVIRDLQGDGAALQQVKGQARLEEFKTKLKEYEDKVGVLSPKERAQMYADVSRILNPSASQDMSMLRTMVDIAKVNEADRDRVANTNTAIQSGLVKTKKDLMEEWRKDEAVTRYQKVRGSARRVRDLTYSKKGGVPDYSTVISYIKTLDPDSTVMFGEAAALYQADGLVDQIIKKPETWWQGNALSEAQIVSLLKSIDQFEKEAKKAYDSARESKIIEAAELGIQQPESVVSAVDRRVDIGDKILKYKGANGKMYDVPEKDRERFEKQMSDAKIKIERRGTE